MTLCRITNSDTPFSKTTSLATLYLPPGVTQDLLEEFFKRLDVHAQTKELVYAITHGYPPTLVGRFVSFYKGNELHDNYYTLLIPSKHERHDQRESERHCLDLCLDITQADKLQILLKYLASHPTLTHPKEALILADKRHVHVFAKANKMLLLEVRMAEFEYVGTTENWDVVVKEISKAFCADTISQLTSSPSLDTMQRHGMKESMALLSLGK